MGEPGVRLPPSGFRVQVGIVWTAASWATRAQQPARELLAAALLDGRRVVRLGEAHDGPYQQFYVYPADAGNG